MSVTNITVLVNGNSQVVSLPYFIPSNTTITLTSNITLQYSTDYFVINGSNIVLDGGYFTVTVIGAFFGLVHNDLSSNIYTNIVIQHFGTNTIPGMNGFKSTGGYTAVNQYCGVYVGGNSNANSNGIDNNFNAGVTVKFCSSTGFSLGNGCGGIFGGNCNTGAAAYNCYSLNQNIGSTIQTPGGIFASRYGYGNGASYNCYFGVSTLGYLNNVGTYFGIGGATCNNCYAYLHTYNSQTALINLTPGNNTNCYGFTESYGFTGFWNESVAEATLTGSPKYYNPGNNPPVNVSPVFGTTWISLSPSMPYILMSDNPDFNTVSYIQSSLGQGQFYNASLVNAVFY